MADLALSIREKLLYQVGADPQRARAEDWLLATIFALRERIVDRWVETERKALGRKRVYYLSIEYLIGRLLFSALSNLDTLQPARAALDSLGVDIDRLRGLEPDAALGNGGLGRLAACYMDSMAALGIFAHGYGIRYEHGLFRQQICEGWQQELPDDWLAFGNPWEFERRRGLVQVRFGGAVEYVGGDTETAPAIWYSTEIVNAIPYDTPVVGWGGRHVNTLRLWSARAAETIRLAKFSCGDYIGASATRIQAEAISQFVYPSDDTASGRELRLRQEFFFTSASLQDILRRHVEEAGDVLTLPDHVAVQLNDTHPALAVAELMRLLVDEYFVSWRDAWHITTTVLNYTNHTLLPEALETWPLALMNHLLPRHTQIIFLINWLHLKRVADISRGDPARLESASLIDEGGERRVRMGHLVFVGSNKINGVSALHTDLMRRTVFSDLDAVYPGRIVNKTNGIDFRRWLFQANPRLTHLIIEARGGRGLTDFEPLKTLESLVGDRSFLERLAAARHANKVDLCKFVREQSGIRLDPHVLFDVHVKRFHEYKRQLLNLLDTIALFHTIRAGPDGDFVPRVKVFAGKAAMTYAQAKLIIKLVNAVASVVNNDPVIGDRLKVVFIPNYGVSLAEAIIPAADVSEQISTAGLEASGTGNMKFALNGALTIGTLDGANIEIREHVGSENICIFGMDAPEVAAMRHAGLAGRDAVLRSALLAETIASLSSGLFSPDDKGRFTPIVEALLGRDEFMVAADFDSYWRAQRSIDERWRDQESWWRTSLLNTARMSWFSSDRAVREYAAEIWRVPVGAESQAR